MMHFVIHEFYQKTVDSKKIHLIKASVENTFIAANNISVRSSDKCIVHSLVLAQFVVMDDKSPSEHFCDCTC